MNRKESNEGNIILMESREPIDFEALTNTKIEISFVVRRLYLRLQSRIFKICKNIKISSGDFSREIKAILRLNFL